MEPYFLFIAFTLGMVAVGLPMSLRNIKLKRALREATDMNMKLMLRDVFGKIMRDAKEKDKEEDKASEA